MIIFLFIATKIDLENITWFQINWDFYQKYLALPENISENIRKPNIIEAAEIDVKIWEKLMERVCDFYRYFLMQVKKMISHRPLSRVNNCAEKLKL